MPREESEYLHDTAVAAQQARSHARGLTFWEFTQSRLQRTAVQWELTVIGEASARISPDTKGAYPVIPWA